MGLFGGFKAKFTRNSTPKSKPGDVVCLKYYVHTEFDGPDPPTPIQHKQDVQKPEVTKRTSKKKERKTLAKSAIFPENETSQTSLSSPAPLKSVSLNDLSITTQINGHAESRESITVETTLSVPANGTSTAISDTKLGKSTEEHNGVVTEKVAIVTNNHVYNKDNNNRSEQHSQTVYTKVSTYDQETGSINTDQYNSGKDISYSKPSPIFSSFGKENGHKTTENDQSTLIFMTQHSSRSSSFDRSMETNDAKTAFPVTHTDNLKNSIDDNYNFTFVPNKSNSDDEADYFKVNMVKHDLNRTHSYSEDERSYQDEEPHFTRMGYSSQAASIFFGEGQEPEIVRPRKIQLLDDTDDNDERRSSGADC